MDIIEGLAAKSKAGGGACVKALGGSYQVWEEMRLTSKS